MSQRDIYKEIIRSEMATAFPRSSLEAFIGLTELNYESGENSDSRLTNLENNETVFQVFSYVGTATSGSLSLYEKGEIFDIYNDSILDAILVKADANQNPIEEPVLDSNGNQVLVQSLTDNGDGTADYLLTSIPVNNSCIIYFIKIKDLYKGNVDNDFVIPPTFKIESNKLENVIRVAKSGGDYATIKEAILSITDNSSTNRYTIQIAPGIYVEDNIGGAIVIPEFIGLEGIGVRSVIIQAQDPTKSLFTMIGVSTFMYLKGLIFSGLTGANAFAVEHLSSGRVNVWQCVLMNCSNGLLLNNALGTLEVKHTVFNNPGGSTTLIGIKVEAGILSMVDSSFRSTSIINTCVDISGSSSIAEIIHMTSLSPLVDTVLKIHDGAFVSGSSMGIMNANDGIVIYGDNTTVRFFSSLVESCQNDGVRIDNLGINIDVTIYSGVINDSGNLNFNILNSNCKITGSGFTQFEAVYIAEGALFIAELIDITEDDEGLNVLGELHVGLPERPSESAFGGGDSYTRGMIVYTYNPSGAVWTDVTTIAKSASGSNFTFPSNDADNSIYMASTLLFGGDYLKHLGIKTKLLVAGDVGINSIIPEYWNGSAWIEVESMEVNTGGNYLSHANNLLQNTGSHQIRYNSQLDSANWVKNDPMGIGTAYYWIRLRITGTIITSPVIEQIKLHTSRYEINLDGWVEYFGNARPIGQLGLNFSVSKPFEGNMQSQTIYINQNIGVGFINNRFTAPTDITGISGFLPFELDTSCPLKLVWSGRPSNNETLTWTIRLDWVNEGDTFYTTEPALLPGSKTVTVQKTVVSGAVELFEVLIDVKEMVARKEVGYGDQLFISMQPSVMVGTFDLVDSQFLFTKWCNGGHVL